jgi:hypothetical protein
MLSYTDSLSARDPDLSYILVQVPILSFPVAILGNIAANTLPAHNLNDLLRTSLAVLVGVYVTFAAGTFLSRELERRRSVPHARRRIEDASHVARTSQGIADLDRVEASIAMARRLQEVGQRLIERGEQMQLRKWLLRGNRAWSYVSWSCQLSALIVAGVYITMYIKDREIYDEDRTFNDGVIVCLVVIVVVYASATLMSWALYKRLCWRSGSILRDRAARVIGELDVVRAKLMASSVRLKIEPIGFSGQVVAVTRCLTASVFRLMRDALSPRRQAVRQRSSGVAR